MIDLSIIIVSYNTKDVLRECLQSIDQYSPANSKFEVIVVDNASKDNSAQMVKKEFKKTILLENRINLGFSKANNSGIKVSRGRYILFLNPDTLLRAKTLDSMVEFMEKNPDAGAATCRVELMSGEIDDASHRGFPTPWNAFSHFSGLSRLIPNSKLFGGYWLSWMNLNTAHEIDACAGAFMIVKRIAGENINWWDEDFFWYGEDLDFCYRLKNKGWKIYYVPYVSILHHKGIAGGLKKHSASLSTADRVTREKATRARFEAMRIFYAKHYQKKYPKLLTWLVMKGIEFKLSLSLKLLK